MRLRIWMMGLFAVCAACEVSSRARRLEPSASSPPVPPDEVALVGVSSELFEGDRLRSLARAATLRLSRKTGQIHASRVQVERFDPDTGHVTGRLTADEATGFADRRDLILEGNVELRDDEARRAMTQRAEYTEKDETLRLPGEVKIAGENFEAVGASATYRLDQQKLEVAAPLRAVVLERER